MTSADIMQSISRARQRSGLLASEHTVKPRMKNNTQQRSGMIIYIPGETVKYPAQAIVF